MGFYIRFDGFNRLEDLGLSETQVIEVFGLAVAQFKRPMQGSVLNRSMPG